MLAQMVEGLAAIDGVTILGTPRRRTPTVSFTVEGRTPEAVVAALADEVGRLLGAVEEIAGSR